MNKIDEEICTKKEIKANLYIEKLGEDDITKNTFFKDSAIQATKYSVVGHEQKFLIRSTPSSE